MDGIIALASQCAEYGDKPYSITAINLFILVGILFSYLPQHYRITHLRSSEGISPFFVLLGTTGGTCMFNAVLLNSREQIRCCKDLPAFQCLTATLTIVQSGIQWVSFVLILMLFLIFFPRATPIRLIFHKPAYREAPGYFTALMVGLGCIIHAIITVILSAYFAFSKPAHQGGWANFLGIQASVLASIQYIPQLITTYRLGKVGSLSILTMLIQAPGSFMWAGAMFASFGAKGWSTWLPLVVSGTLQGMLLQMALRFEYLARKEAKNSPGSDSNGHTNGRVHSVPRQETDDEGGHNVEGDGDHHRNTSDDEGPSERSPLLRKKSRR